MIPEFLWYLFFGIIGFLAGTINMYALYDARINQLQKHLKEAHAKLDRLLGRS